MSTAPGFPATIHQSTPKSGDRSPGETGRWFAAATNFELEDFTCVQPRMWQRATLDETGRTMTAGIWELLSLAHDPPQRQLFIVVDERSWRNVRLGRAEVLVRGCYATLLMHQDPGDKRFLCTGVKRRLPKAERASLESKGLKPAKFKSVTASCYAATNAWGEVIANAIDDYALLIAGVLRTTIRDLLVKSCGQAVFRIVEDVIFEYRPFAEGESLAEALNALRPLLVEAISAELGSSTTPEAISEAVSAVTPERVRTAAGPEMLRLVSMWTSSEETQRRRIPKASCSTYVMVERGAPSTPDPEHFLGFFGFTHWFGDNAGQRSVAIAYVAPPHRGYRLATDACMRGFIDCLQGGKVPYVLEWKDGEYVAVAKVELTAESYNAFSVQATEKALSLMKQPSSWLSKVMKKVKLEVHGIESMKRRGRVGRSMKVNAFRYCVALKGKRLDKPRLESPVASKRQKIGRSVVFL